MKKSREFKKVKKGKSCLACLLAVLMLITSMAVYLPQAQEVQAAETMDSTQTGLEFVQNMRIGWNLGNSLESTNLTWISKKTPANVETGWGNPITTKAMIDKVKGAGYNALRIPVTWENFIDTSTSSYTIKTEWLERVKEVVDYGIANDMYVIINTHHDGWLTAEKSKEAEATKEFTAVWKQIANYFNSYDEHLIFEGANEVRVGEDWNGNATAYGVINRLNQKFVDTVRATGGNNKTRYLMIQTYAGSCWEDAIKALTVPKDSRVIVDLHAYVPYNFALNTNSSDGTYNTSGNGSEQTTIKYVIDLAYKYFVQKGTGVVIGEMGCLNKNNIADRKKWTQYFVSYAKSKQMPCFWWDNNADTSGETFGLLNRKNMTWYHGDLVSAMVSAADESTSMYKSTIKVATAVYTGSALKPTVTVKIGSKTLKSGTDYTLTYYNNTKIGKARVRVQGIGAYAGYKDIYFSIIPPKPTVNGVTSNSTKKNTVTWTPVKGAQGYYVYHKLPGGSWVRIANITSQGTSTYTDTAITVGKTYLYTVKAYAKSGSTYYYSTYETPGKASLATVAFTTKKNANKTVTINWNLVSNATGYVVYRKEAGGSWARILTSTSATVKTFTDKKATAGKTYYYTVKAYNSSKWFGFYKSSAAIKI